MAQTASTLAVIRAMEAALSAGSDDMAAHFHEDFVWRGNRGCGVKRGLAEFRRGWQLPLRAAFSDRVYQTERMIAQDDWAAAFGQIEATHSGPFMGIAPTGHRVTIPYMDFWRVADGRIVDNPVFVDFAAVLHQLGRDVFAGAGWDSLEARTPAADSLKEST
ncbi:MAG: ester cyclase [Roseinatronobacter sp.]